MGRRRLTPQDRIERIPDGLRQELRLGLELLREAELGHRQAETRLASACERALEAGATWRDIGELLAVPHPSLFQLTKRRATEPVA